MLTLGVLSLAYPVSQALRLTKDGAEYATRPMDFLFIAVAFVVAVVAVWFMSRFGSTIVGRVALPIAALTVIFAGGVAIGSGPSWTQLPGPHIVEGNQRSFGPEDITAAQWALHYLGSGNRVATDHDDALLMGTYGVQNIVTAQQGVDLVPVYFAYTVGQYERGLLQRAHVRYVVVDLRLASALPADGAYYASSESSGPTPYYNRRDPISTQALTKYDSMAGADCIYDSGNMIIYDTGLVTENGNYQP
jgi:hypothetical protein